MILFLHSEGQRMRRKGFSHVVVNTAHADTLGGFLAALGWHCQTQALDDTSMAFWGITDTRGAMHRWRLPHGGSEVILLPASAETPLLRPLTSPVITPGGIFDINMRTDDSHWACAFLETHGWRELVQPVAWQFGAVETKEGLFIQDDGIVLAVMQRLHPPLEGIQFDRMSDIFNSTQMVTSVERSLAFLQLFGFEQFVDHRGPLPGEGARVLQLEDQPVETAHVRLSIAHPSAAMDGSIELIDVPAHPLPPIDVPALGGRGLRALCIPLENAARSYERLMGSEWSDKLIHPLAHRQLPGSLNTTTFSVAAPDGGRLDFYQCGD
jgi:hypothetical protein